MTTLHGVALNIFGWGVLIVGDSGCGKTDLGLELISRGHQLIADDAVSITLDNQNLTISNPQSQFIMYIRGLGFMDIERTFGKFKTLASCRLNLIIRLVDVMPTDPLAPANCAVELLGIPLTECSLWVGNNRPIATLAEVLVKYHQQRASGWDSHQQFIDKHAKRTYIF